ncbi:MAG: DUF4194 domain-containing protein [Peptococcaceae bacterium]|nr:DUF4194 domain-containing protein [Peptococcaceae bacterium]
MHPWERFEQMSVKERDEFARIVNKLLASTFITRRNEENKKDYYFIERNEELFRQYLRLAGWTLTGDRSYSVYQAVSDFPANRLHLRLEESIILLIIRLCYEEKRKEINLTDNILLKVREIQDKYAALKIRARPIDKKSLREAVSLFKRFNILQPLDGDVTDPECRLEVYPTVLFAVRVDDLRSVYDKLESYRNDSSPGEEDEEPDNERIDQN